MARGTYGYRSKPLEIRMNNPAASYGVSTLTGYIGYDRAAEVAYLCRETAKTVREVVSEQHLLDEKTLDEILRSERLTSPGAAKTKEK